MLPIWILMGLDCPDYPLDKLLDVEVTASV